MSDREYIGGTDALEAKRIRLQLRSERAIVRMARQHGVYSIKGLLQAAARYIVIWVAVIGIFDLLSHLIGH